MACQIRSWDALTCNSNSCFDFLAAVATNIDWFGTQNTGGYQTPEVIFSPWAKPPLLTITDVGDTAIPDTTNWVITVAGSTARTYTTLGTEFFRLAVPYPNTIEVLVNDIPSSCSAPGSAPCTFEYQAALTPEMTAVSPTLLDFTSNGASSLTLAVTATGLSSNVTDNILTVGDSMCQPVSVDTDSGTLTCSLPNTTPAGLRMARLTVSPKGYARGAFNVTVKTLGVSIVFIMMAYGISCKYDLLSSRLSDVQTSCCF